MAWQTIALPSGVLLVVGTLTACGSSSAHTPTATPTLSPTAPALHGWNAVASPGVSPEGHLSAVTARSASEAWAVGEYEDTSVDGATQALIVRYTA